MVVVCVVVDVVGRLTAVVSWTVVVVAGAGSTVVHEERAKSVTMGRRRMSLVINRCFADKFVANSAGRCISREVFLTYASGTSRPSSLEA